MFYKLRKDSFIRHIGEFGYIKSVGIFNDLVVDESGKVFLDCLSREPQDVYMLAKNISKSFVDVTPEDILSDVQDFYDMLVDDGYLSAGESAEEADLNDTGFSYNNIRQITFEEDYTPKNVRGDEDTQTLLDKYLEKTPWISNFQFELTSRCNERCIHCYIPHEYKNTDISEELYYSVLNQLSEMGTLGVTLSGGEPMAHPKFKEFLKAAKDKDFYVHILSNLVLLDDEILQIMKDGTCCGVQVSLYSMIPENHDAITTVPGSFEKTKSAILKLIENDIPVQISCPLMNANKDDFPEVCRWAHEHKIRAITDYAIMAEYNHDKSNLANRLTPEECRDVIKGIIEADETYRDQILSDDFNTNLETINTDPDEPLCGVGINTCCMVANGNVYPCPGWQGYVCGNLNEKSLKEIWFNSEEMNYLRSRRKKDLPKCMDCKNRAFCSPCMGRFANESKTGNPFEVAEHFCQVANVNREVVLDWREKFMDDLNSLRKDILCELKRKNLKKGHVWMEREIVTFIAELPVYKKEIFEDAVNDLIGDGYISICDKNPNAIALTDIGERYLYEQL